MYVSMLAKFIFLKAPFFKKSNHADKKHTEIMFDEMLSVIEKNHKDVCAVIIEPLVQCAGYMRMYHPIYLKLLRKACDKYNIHLIVDEIAVGFGRTGSMFAFEQSKITPDIICLSKGITGGYMTLSAILTTNMIYKAFYDEYNKLNAFLHSHSYTANPIACTAANASLDLFEKIALVLKLTFLLNGSKIYFILNLFFLDSFALRKFKFNSFL